MNNTRYVLLTRTILCLIYQPPPPYLRNKPSPLPSSFCSVLGQTLRPPCRRQMQITPAARSLGYPTVSATTLEDPGFGRQEDLLTKIGWPDVRFRARVNLKYWFQHNTVESDAAEKKDRSRAKKDVRHGGGRGTKNGAVCRGAER